MASNFEAKVIGILDTSQIESKLQSLQNTKVTLSNFQVGNLDAVTSAIQNALNGHQFNIDLNINGGNGLSNFQNRLNTSMAQITTTTNVASNAISQMERNLQALHFDRSAIDLVTKDLNNMGLAISNVTTSLRGKNVIDMTVRGVDSLNRSVTIVRQLNTETGKFTTVGKTISQSFDTGATSAKQFAKELENATNALNTNKLESQIAGVTSQYEKLGSTTHPLLEQIGQDIERLNELNETMNNSTDNTVTVESYREYSRILEQIRNNLSIVASETQEATAAEKEFAKELETATNAISSGKIESSLASVTSQFEKLGSTGHERLEQIESDIKELTSLQQTMANTNDPEQMVTSYERYMAILERVKNSLSVVKSETQDVATAQKTLSSSNTLSNNIETWMNNNKRAAKEYGDELRNLQNQLKNNTDPSALTQVAQRFREIKSEAQAAGLTTNSFAKSITSVGAQLLGLTSTVMIIRKIIALVKDGVNTVVELDTALVDLQKTSTASGNQLAKFYREANEAAKEYGATTKDIIQSAADWSRLGYNLADSQTMSKLTAMFKAISPGMSMEDATEGLVSVMKAFKIDADDALDGIMSKINAVGNGFALANSDIVAGLKVSSASMQAANNDLDQTIALITAGTEITQDASRVGNGLRTISMRIRGMNEETEELDDNLVNIKGDVAELTHGKVSIMEDADTYKSTYEVLKEVSEVWDELTDKEQANLLEKLFGKTRAQVGASIISNFQAAEKAMDTMANSAGNAEKEMDIIVNSLEYKLNRLKQTGVGIWQGLLDRGDIGNVVDKLTGILEIVQALTDKLGLFKTALLAISGIAVFKNIGKNIARYGCEARAA